ncbi:MAG: beta strand repeat-containing protein, partial [Spongiibacteraceae bacterium]
TITLTAAQIEDIGLANITAETGLGTTTLNVANLSDELIDLSSAVTGSGFDAVGTVTILDVNGTVTLNAGTNLSGATTVTIDAQTSDTTAEMSTAQFNQIAGATPDVEAAIGTNAVTGSPYVATMVLTGAQAEDVLDLTEVGDLSGGTPPSLVDVILRLDGVTAGEDFSVFGHAVTLEVASGVNDLSATDDVFINGLPNTGTVDGVGVVSVGSVVLTGGELTLTAGQLAAIIANNTGTIEETFAGSTGGTLNITEFAAQAFDLDELEALGINIGTITLLDSNVPIAINAATTFGDADEIVTPTADQNDSTAFADTVNGLEPTTLTMTVAQFLSSAGIISGDSEVDLTGLTNNVDSDGDFVVDQTEVDLSGIANAGTLTFATDTDGATVVSHVITLTSTANLGGFALELANGELIRYATETQAAAVVNEAAAVTTATGIQWLFTSVTGPVDTSGYDGDINHLFIDEALLASQPREEDLWTNLEGTIFVEKVNGATIPEFYKYDRVNTFEAFTSLPGGVNYDDAEDFSTIGSLLINLEGEVNIASILVGDTNNGNGSTPNVDGKGYFSSLVINSYEDLSTAEGYNPTAGSVSGRIVEANYIGDISLNVGSVDELVDITISTYGTDSAGATTTTADDQYSDPINVNGAQDDRDGLAIEVGTITFDALASTTFTTGQTPADATLTLRGANDITIAGVDISDSEVNLLFIDANEHSASLEIGGIAPVGGLNGFGEIYVANGFSGLGTIGDSADTAGLVDLLVIDGGDNDFTDAALDIENLHVTGDATITLTATQVIAITSANFSVDAGVTVTLNVTELGATLLDLNTIQDAGFNIGVVSTVEDNGSGAVSTVLNDNTTLGGADELRVLLNDEDNSLTLTATQYLQLNGGNITELDSDATDVNSAAVTITDVSTSSNAVDISNPNGDDRVSVNLDLSTVATTGAHLLDIADTNVAADVTIDSASDLSDFSVSLDDIDDDNQTGTAAGGTIGDETPNELSGQTVRFTNEVQAGRDILVEGYDPGAVEGSTSGGGTVGNLLDSEADTNVVWDFDSVTGPIQTSGYDFELGRLWVSDVLVASDNDLEDLFSASDVDGNSLEDDINLNGSIIVRIVNTQSLDSFNDDSIGFSRFVEVEAFTDISATGLVFDEQDQLVDVRNLTIDLGGEVSLGNLELGNVLAAANVTPNTDEFGVLTINSFLATNSDHYLMPEDFVDGTNVPPSGGNVIGDISAAVNRQELDQVVINATDVELTINTIFFSDDGDSSDSGIATLTLSGDNTVTIKSLDISDAEITNVVIDNNLTPSTLYVTGGSPGVDGGDTSQNTEVLSIASGGVTGVGEIQTVELSGAVLADGTVTFMGTDIAVLAADTLDDVGAAIAAADVAIQANNPDLAAGTSAVAYNATTNTLTVTFLAAAGNVATLVTATDNGIIFDDGVITQESTTPSTIFGSTVGGTTYAGVSGGELSEIVITENGRVELGVIALVDTLEFSIDAAATAYVTATLGEADANGLQAPDLADGGTWVIDNVDELTVDGSTDFGAGSLSITGSSITLTGDVDFTALLALTVSVGTSILLTDGATFRLTAEQIDYLNDQGVTIE